MAVDPSSRFQRSVFLSGRGHSYYADAPGMPLSLKCMFNGRARYRFDRTETAVDDQGYLILNEGQPYTIEIASPTPVESFIVWFPRGWAEEVRGTLDATPERLLDNLPNDCGAVQFFSRYTRHDDSISPKAQVLRSALKSRHLMSDGWLEEKIRELLAAMLANQNPLQRQIANLPAVRVATREELWRRINLARDYLHARLSGPVPLSEVAAAACLSPFHLLRVFRSAFGQTPHQYLNRCRIERAKFLLAQTRIPVTAICLECGFTSLGSFSSLFARECGISPRKWRERHGSDTAENSKIREVYLASAA